MEDLMYQFSWLSNQALTTSNSTFDPSLILFEIDAYRSWAAMELNCQEELQEAQNSMAHAEEEINSAMDSAMAEFQRFAEGLEREAMDEYQSLVNAGDAARKMGFTLEKAASVASKKYVEAALSSATNSMRSAWKGINSSRKVHPS